MRATRNESTETTIAHIQAAIDAKRPVTLSYKDVKGDDTVRTIEPYEVRTTAAGETVIVAMCRLREERRTFRLDRVTHYTVHRGTFYLPEIELDEVSNWTITSRTGHEIARVTVYFHKDATTIERYEAVKVEAMKLAKVRAVSKGEGGFGCRRLAD